MATLSKRENEQGNDRVQMDSSRWPAIQASSDYRAFAGLEFDSRPMIGNPFRKLVGRGCRVQPDRALPYHCDAPTQTQELFNSGQIPLTIGSELCVPELRSCLRQPEEWATFMAMPKTAMYEHHCPPFREQKVRLSCQPLPVKAKSEAARPQLSPDHDLRLGVLGPDSRHQC